MTRSIGALAIVVLLLLVLLVGGSESRQLDSKIKSSTYSYIKDIGEAKDVEVITVHLKNVIQDRYEALVIIDRISQVSDSNPSQVINGSLEEITISTAKPLKLEEGYKLFLKAAKTDGAVVELTKNGLVVDSAEVTIPHVEESNFIYTREIDGANVELINVHFKNVFRGADADIATVDSFWQASENNPSLTIKSSSKERIITSYNPLTLGEGYMLALRNVDFEGNKAYVELTKDSQVVHSSVITPPNLEEGEFVYAKQIGQAKEVKVIDIHFKNAFAGPDTNIATIDSVWQVSDNNPSLVINNSSKEMIFSSDKPLRLGDGYVLAIRSVDIRGNKAYLELAKDGQVLYNAVIIPPGTKNGTFIYSKAGQARDVELINVRFKNAFAGPDTNIATIDSVWQASDNNPSLVINNSSKEMIISSYKPLRLGEGYVLAIKSIDIRGNKTYIELTKDGQTVHGSMITPPNLEDGKFVYSKQIGQAKEVKVIEIDFKNVFRGADVEIATVDSVWQASESNPSLVINSSPKARIITSANPLKLGEGYMVAIKTVDVDGNKVYVELTKDDQVVHSSIITPPKAQNGTFIYNKDVGRAKDAQVLAVHFKNVFAGAETNIATIDSVWQASDSNPSHIVNSSFDDILITSGRPLKLDEGYELAIKSVDIKGNKGYIVLSKDGQVVNSAVVRPSELTTEGLEEIKILNASKVLEMIGKGKPVNYNNITIEGDLDISKVNIEKSPSGRNDFEIAVLGLERRGILVRVPIVITNSEIRGDVNLKNVIFKEKVDFGGTNFSGQSIFDGDQFKRYAFFKGSNFSHPAQFEGAHFNGGANFQDAQLRGGGQFNYAQFSRDALFDESNFLNDAYFWGANFNGAVNFQDAKFGGNADFSGSKFKGDATFKNSQFNKFSYFRGANFSRIADFNAAQFVKEAFFEEAMFNILSLTLTKYEKFYVRWANIKELQFDDTAYQLLLKNFENLGFFADAAGCYYQYRNGGRQYLPTYYKPVDWMLMVLYGYGTKPELPLAWSIFVIICYGIFWRSKKVGIKENCSTKLPTDIKGSSSSNLHNELFMMIEPFIFSATVFLSGTKLFVDPPDIPEKPGRSRSLIKLLFILERVLGGSFSVLFFFAISRTIIR